MRILKVLLIIAGLILLIPAILYAVGAITLTLIGIALLGLFLVGAAIPLIVFLALILFVFIVVFD